MLTTRGINRQIRERDAETVFHVDGLAASAATVLACACDRRVAARGSRILIHEAWVFAIGNKRRLRTEADDLEKTDQEIAEDYAAIGNLTAAEFAALMEEEQLLTPKEALAHGLIDAISAGAKQNKNAFAIRRAFTDHATHVSRGN